MFETQYGLKDVGTRFEHYRELLELWEIGLAIMEEKAFKSDEDTGKIVQLRESTELLRAQLDIMSGFNAGNFSNSCYPLKLMIDALPSAEQIDGGRGTPLNDKEPIG